eukprot:5302183-Pyramimonas_sp.AAC.1
MAGFGCNAACWSFKGGCARPTFPAGLAHGARGCAPPLRSAGSLYGEPQEAWAAPRGVSGCRWRAGRSKERSEQRLTAARRKLQRTTRQALLPRATPRWRNADASQTCQ